MKQYLYGLKAVCAVCSFSCFDELKEGAGGSRERESRDREREGVENGKCLDVVKTG
jgi:hypothetical protein